MECGDTDSKLGRDSHIFSWNMVITPAIAQSGPPVELSQSVSSINQVQRERVEAGESLINYPLLFYGSIKFIHLFTVRMSLKYNSYRMIGGVSLIYLEKSSNYNWKWFSEKNKQ